VRKPTDNELFELNRCECVRAAHGHGIDYSSVRGRVRAHLLRNHWVTHVATHDTHRLEITPAGERVVRMYHTVALTCSFCDWSMGCYVAKRGVTKVLKRKCRTCDYHNELTVG